MSYVGRTASCFQKKKCAKRFGRLRVAWFEKKKREIRAVRIYGPGHKNQEEKYIALGHLPAHVHRSTLLVDSYLQEQILRYS